MGKKKGRTNKCLVAHILSTIQIYFEKILTFIIYYIKSPAYVQSLVRKTHILQQRKKPDTYASSSQTSSHILLKSLNAKYLVAFSVRTISIWIMKLKTCKDEWVVRLELQRKPRILLENSVNKYFLFLDSFLSFLLFSFPFPFLGND